MHGEREERPRLLFIDTETTGLDPTFHEIIEVAAILTDHTGSEVIRTMEAKVAPRYLERMHPKALAVNGYNEEEWRTAEEPHVVAENMTAIAEKAVLVGSNVSFDEQFWLTFLRANARKPTWSSFRKVDTIALSWPLLVKGKIPGSSLKRLCEYFGIPPEPDTHRAMNGAEKCRMVYVKLMELYANL